MDITYKVSEKALAPVEVRAFLRKECGFSHGLWRRLKWNGRLLINNDEVHCTTAMAQAGDEIRCIIPEESSLVATPMKLDIRYENEYLLVLNKPTGILVHPQEEIIAILLAMGFCIIIGKLAKILIFILSIGWIEILPAW